MKYLITGANGQLAKEFAKIIDGDLFAYPREKLDISDEKELKDCIDFVKPSILINTAAYNNVDGAETDFEMAYKINAVSVGKLAEYCERYKTKIVHFSTDYVFGGKKEHIPYTEDDKPEPLNKYGFTKLEGEKNLIKNYENFIIFRVSWLYGKGKQNFIYKFKSWSEKSKMIKVSVDEVSVPTPVKMVAEVTMKAIKNDLRGLWHLIPDGFVSRYDWAKKINEILNLNIDLIKSSQSDFNSPAKRPEFSAMNNNKIKRDLSVGIKSWEEYLYDYLVLKNKDAL